MRLALPLKLVAAMVVIAIAIEAMLGDRPNLIAKLPLAALIAWSFLRATRAGTR